MLALVRDKKQLYLYNAVHGLICRVLRGTMNTPVNSKTVAIAEAYRRWIHRKYQIMIVTRWIFQYLPCADHYLSTPPQCHHAGGITNSTQFDSLTTFFALLLYAEPSLIIIYVPNTLLKQRYYCGLHTIETIFGLYRRFFLPLIANTPPREHPCEGGTIRIFLPSLLGLQL